MNPNPTKRFFCRAIFLALGLLPLLGTFSWAAYRGLYQTNTSYARLVGDRLGMECKIGNVVHVRPGTIRFEGVRLQDAEDLTIVVECGAVVVQSSDFEREVRIPALSVADGKFRRLLKSLDERVLQNPRTLDLPTVVQIDQLAIHSNGSAASTLKNIRLEASLTDVGPQANVEFALLTPQNKSGGETNERIRMDVIREMTRPDSSESAPVTRLNLLTGKAKLPCSLLAGFFGSHHLNPEATFRGNIHLDSDSRVNAAWTGDVSGHLENLRLEEICSLATGTAKLTFRKATFEKGSATLLDGTLAVNGGTLNSEFVSSAVENLGMTVGEGHQDFLADPSGLVPFDFINVDFVIENGESTLKGIVPSGSPGDLAIVNGKSLFSQPPSKVRNVDLLRTLLGLSPEQVPVANDSALLRAFPQ